MTIYCYDIAEFLDAIEGLVQRGLTFKADMKTYTITLTGGF
jgi:hypothetical protein